MNDFAKSVWFWRLAVVKCGFKCVAAAFTSLVAVLNGTNFADYTPTQQVVAIAAISASVLSVIDAFLSETISDLKQKKREQTVPPFKPSDI